MAQYPIPQFIEAEGKIIPFLTFRQFFILVGGGAACLALYYILPFSLFIVFAIFIGILVAIIAFIKIDNASVISIFFDFIKFTNQAKNYVWKKQESQYPFKIKKHYQAKGGQEFNAQEAQANKLKEIKKLVELRKR